MTKKYCDICEIEIKAESEFGLIIRFVKATMIDPRSKSIRTEIQEKHIELCEKCVEVAESAVSKMKKSKILSIQK